MATTATSDVGPGAGAPFSSIITTVRRSLTSLANKGKQHARKPEDGHAQITRLIATQPKPNSPPHPPDSQASSAGKDSHEKPPLHLLALPTELLNNILRHLNFVSILELRKTCRFFHTLASPPQLRILFGREQLTTLLLQHCKTCLVHDPFRSNLLSCSHEDEGWPLASQCVDCALVANDERLKIGKRVKLGTEDVVQICRWCGRPIRNHEGVAGPPDPNSPGTRRDGRPFHKGNCYRSYNNSLLFFFILGWVQLTLGITGAGLSWRYWRGAVMVFAPSVTSFLLLWIVMGFLFFRGSRKRAYRYTLLLELAILGCWIPPVYYISMQIVNHPERDVDAAMQAALALFGLNLVFRLFNVMGNIVILCSTPDLTPRKKPNAGLFKRAIYKLMLWSVAWTYPPSVEHRLSSE
ncbi:hypothetical protein QC761_611700 [Podospora bellae-mahoneyi]|uniref:F-box domain-containing protein n=1 Tax=Podospora bellae-mahoneyi TaxID=2093777 RepID=A0ABR0FAF7_9PEZI|nr:hypothetical protein QC761_611700 [Podospora bellae-mahoneyi]